MLVMIHSGHPGVQSGIRRAKQVLFWVNMGKDIQDMVECCSVCQQHQRCNQKSTIVMKEVPELPFERVASDLFHFRGEEYVLIVDSWSNFFDFKKLSQSTSEEVIDIMKNWFATHGVPRVLESDNGPQYNSLKFRNFSEDWGFEHRTSSPHFPRSNGLAERFVQVAKNLLKKCHQDGSDLHLALLLARNTPRSDTIPSPNERLMSRLTRSTLPMSTEILRPKTIDGVRDSLCKERQLQKAYADRGARNPADYEQGDRVMVQDPKSKQWFPSKVLRKFGSNRSYLLSDGERTFRRNTQHIRERKFDLMESNDDQAPETLVSNPANGRQTVACERNGADTNNEVNQDRVVEAEPGEDISRYSTRSGRVVKDNKKTDFEYY